MKRNNNVNYAIVAIVTFLIFLFQQFASITGGRIADKFSYEAIDKDGVFAWISVHHVGQLILSIIVIIILSIIFKLNFRFQLGDIKKGTKALALLTIILFFYHILAYAIGYAANMITPYHYPLTVVNIFGYLGFQLLLTGTEEVLFRALPITLLALFLNSSKGLRLWKLTLPYEVILAAFLFSIAHINWYTDPFTITYDLIQLIFSFVVGIVYGVTYQKTDSILYPMLMHSITNVIVVGMGYLIVVLF